MTTCIVLIQFCNECVLVKRRFMWSLLDCTGLVVWIKVTCHNGAVFIAILLMSINICRFSESYLRNSHVLSAIIWGKVTCHKGALFISILLMSINICRFSESCLRKSFFICQYNEVKWTSWRFIKPSTRLFMQQLFRLTTTKKSRCHEKIFKSLRHHNWCCLIHNADQYLLQKAEHMIQYGTR